MDATKVLIYESDQFGTSGKSMNYSLFRLTLDALYLRDLKEDAAEGQK